MAVKLNLLPTDYALTGPVRQIIKVVRSLNVVFLALFFVAAIGMGGFFVFSSISLNNLVTENNKLKSQIQAQSVAQQQVVLLKDRLAQIKTARATLSATKSFEKIKPVLDLVTGNSFISELGIDSQKTTASVIFKSNSELTSFLKNISSNTTFASVSLGTFSYSPAMGYQIELRFTYK